MDQNYLLQAFSKVCLNTANNIHDILPNLEEDSLMITIVSEDAPIKHVDDWWRLDNHLAKFIAYLTEVESNVEGGMQKNIDAGIEELRQHPHLLDQLQAIHDRSHAPTAEILKYIPHVAEYSQALKETEGYKYLDQKCQEMDNVVAWPIITANGKAIKIENAFLLNIALLSTDNMPLKPKIEKLPRPSV